MAEAKKEAPKKVYKEKEIKEVKERMVPEEGVEKREQEGWKKTGKKIKSSFIMSKTFVRKVLVEVIDKALDTKEEKK